MEERKELEQDLKAVNTSLVFLILIVLAILLAFWSTLLQREQVKTALRGGDPSRIPSVYPLRCVSSSITVGSLGFFLCLALGTLAKAQAGNDPAVCRSARVNAFASLLVLLSALLRFQDLQAVERERQSVLLEETTLPD